MIQALAAALPGLISAGASWLGGKKAAQAQEDNNARMAAEAEKERQLQREFAQSGIQWKVADAEKAGIHPLYALGANTISYSPQSVGSNATDWSYLGDVGQNIGRAVQATQSNSKRAEAFATTAQQLQLEGLSLDNDLKRTQIASAHALASQPGTGPGIPSLFSQTGQVVDGQGDSEMLIGHRANSPQYTTNIRFAGHDVEPSRNWSDAQTYEDRYGEMSDWLFGPMIALADYWKNVNPIVQREVYGKLRR